VTARQSDDEFRTNAWFAVQADKTGMSLGDLIDDI